MADNDFPVSPSLNATYSNNGRTWIWDGTRWRANNVLPFTGGGTGFYTYNTGDILVGTGNGLSILPVGTANTQYLRVDSSSGYGLTWKPLPDNGVISTGTAYDIAYYKYNGKGVYGSSGSFTFYDVENFESVTINSNYSYAFSVRNKANNNKFIIDIANARTVLTGNGAAHELRVYNNNESAYFGLKSNSTGTQTYIMPPGGPSTGSSILQSDTSGNLIWVAMTGGLSSAVTSINSQTGPSITLQTGSSGTDFTISASTNTITFDLPSASATNRGLVTTGSQTFAGTKTFSSSISGNLSGTATTSENVNVTTTTRTSDHYLLFTNASSGSGLALTTSTVGSGLTYNPATNTLNALIFAGTAVSSRNVHTGQYTNNSVHYLTFTLQSNGAGAALSTSNSVGKLTYRPADEQLSVTNITGTAFTATYLTGSLTGNVIGTATTSQNVNVNTTTRSATHYLTFTNASNGSGLALTTSTIGIGFTVNPAKNTLAAGTFIGNISGTAGTLTELHTGPENFTNLFGGVYNPVITAADNFSDDLSIQIENKSNSVSARSNLLLINDASEYAQISLNSSLYSGAGDESNFEIYASNGKIRIISSANITSRISSTDVFKVSSTKSEVLVNTSSSSTSTGSLIVSGGMGLAGNAFIGGTFVITNTTFATNPKFGALNISGGLGLLGNASIASSVLILDGRQATSRHSGALIVNGGMGVSAKLWSENIETTSDLIVGTNLQVNGNTQLGNAGLSDTVGFSSRIQSIIIPQAHNTFDVGLNDGTYAWRNAAFAGHGTFVNLYGTTSANLTGVEFSGGDVNIKTGKSIKIYETANTYYTSFKANTSLATNTDYTLPVAKPGTGASILQSDTSGAMIWVNPASNKATYVLSFGAGFTPTTGLDTVSIAIPYADDGTTSLTYTIKRVDVRTETAPGASTLAFFIERHTAGDATWSAANTIKGASSANFSVGASNYSASFTTITSSSGNNGEVQSGNYLRLNFASVGSAANVSVAVMITQN